MSNNGQNQNKNKNKNKKATPSDGDKPRRKPIGLDALDARDAKGLDEGGWWTRLKRLAKPITQEDIKIYRRLFKYVRPYLGRIVLATVIAAVAGSLVAGNLFVLKNVLSTLDLGPGQQSVGTTGTAAPDEKKETQDQPPGTQQADPPQVVEETEDTGKKEEQVDPGAKAKENEARKGGKKAKKQEKKEKEKEAPSRLQEFFSTGSAQGDLNLAVLMLLALSLVGALCKYIQSIVMAVVSRKVIRRLREDCFAQLVRLPLRFHQSSHTGNVLARIIKDINRMKMLLISISMRAVRELFAFIAVLVVIVYETTWIAPLAIIFLIAVFIPIRVVADKLRHRDKEAEAGSSDMFAIITEALANQKVLKSFSAEKKEIKRFKTAARSVYKKQIVTFKLRSATEPLVDIVSGLAIAGCIWWLGGEVLDGTINVASLAVVVIALQRLSASARKLGKMQNDFIRGITAAGRVNLILEQTPEIKEAKDAVPLRSFQNGIEFDGVTFEYDEDEPVLQDVSFRINCGETVALVGPSGAGKTSLVDLMPRLYDVDGGEILIDGRNVNEYTLTSLRESIGAVTQETLLFRDSIRENISYGAEAPTEEAVMAAARAANAHEFILKKRKGYDTPIGERGGRLSGGERQRIAIARALLKNPPILILDEATSSLDAESEAQVQSALNYLMDGRTTVVIAHRLSTIRQADRIIVLDKGRIQEQGTHDELMQINGRYATAYNLQLEALSRGEKSTFDDFFSEEKG